MGWSFFLFFFVSFFISGVFCLLAAPVGMGQEHTEWCKSLLSPFWSYFGDCLGYWLAGWQGMDGLGELTEHR
jgi:hypothetical protein